MRRRAEGGPASRGVWLSAALLALGPAPMRAGAEPAAASQEQLSAREAELAAVALSRRSEELAAEARDLREQVRTLTVSLAAARAELDVLRARAEAGAWRAAEAATPAAALTRESLGVVEANAAMELVVLDAGARDGVRSGMALSILRGDTVLARARVVDVRESISGALVERVEEEFPKAGDRAVVARTETRER